MFKQKILRVFIYTASLIVPLLAAAAERGDIPEFTEFGNTDESTKLQVHALIDSFKDTWAAQDTTGHLRLFSADSEWTNAYARIFRGTGELEIFLRERLFPAFSAAVSQEEIRNARLISIRYLNNNAAVIHLYTDGNRGPSAIENEPLRRTHIHLVAEKTESQWLIVHTAIMDARD